MTTASASGLLGKVGLGAASAQLQLRAESAEALSDWVRGLRPPLAEAHPDEDVAICAAAGAVGDVPGAQS